MLLLSNARYPCMRCPTPCCDRSQKNWLALSRKLGICINSGKEDNLVRYTQIFEKIFLEISVPFDFHPGISGIFGWVVRFSEIQQFPYFLELFLGNFRTICPRFENFEIFGWMVSAHVYTDTEKFRHSLPSQCFNPRQPTRSALNFPQNLFVRWESPLVADLFLE